jgi:oligoendopeptidase F
MNDIKQVIEIARELEDLSEKYSSLSWTQYTTGFDFGVNQAYEKLTEVLKNKKYYQIIKDHQQKQLDPLDKRRIDIITLAFKPYHLSDELNQLDLKIQNKTVELSQILNKFRFTLDGKEIRSTEIAQILRSEPDRDRRKRALLCRAQINKPMIESGFIDLINMRKEYASLYGAKNFVEYRLEFDELDPKMFDNWSGQIKRFLPQMKDVNNTFGKQFIKDEKVMPWDLAYISAQIAPQLNQVVDMSKYYEKTQNLFSKFGIDITKYNITYDLFPRKNKSEWGYSFTIRTGKDNRVLANIENRYHEFEVLLHETGHAVHSFSLDGEDIILNMCVSGIIGEGFANLWGHFLYDKEFFGAFFKDNLKDAETAFTNLKKWHKAIRIRAVPDIFFDQSLYHNEIKTLDDINELYSKQYKLILDEEKYTDNPAWAYRIHHTTHPIYLHNYFLGDLTCEMLRSHFLKTAGVSTVVEKPKEFGQFLLDSVIKPSGTYPFLKLFEKISGEQFSLKYLE